MPHEQEEQFRQSNQSAGDAHEAPGEFRRIGAEGFGLDERQQEAIADLWAWQKDSLNSDLILGGPIE